MLSTRGPRLVSLGKEWRGPTREVAGRLRGVVAWVSMMVAALNFMHAGLVRGDRSRDKGASKGKNGKDKHRRCVARTFRWGQNQRQGDRCCLGGFSIPPLVRTPGQAHWGCSH